MERLLIVRRPLGFLLFSACNKVIKFSEALERLFQMKTAKENCSLIYKTCQGEVNIGNISDQKIT